MKNVTIDSTQIYSYGFLSKLGFYIGNGLETEMERGRTINKTNSRKKAFTREWQISRGTLKMHEKLHQKRVASVSD